MESYCVTKSPDTFISRLKTAKPAIIAVLIFYFFSIILTPIVSNIINIETNNLFLGKNKKSNFYSSGLKVSVSATTEITTVTYVSNDQMLAWQIGDDNLQSYINDAKGSVLKLNNSNNRNLQNYNYDAYGNIIKLPRPLSLARGGNSVLSQNGKNPLSQVAPTTGSSVIAGRRARARHNNLNTGLSHALYRLALMIENPFQYNGERFDNNTNLQYLRARFYSPQSKRFINQDTYDFLNKFNYVSDNPVMKSDPMGNDAWDNVKNVCSKFTDWFEENLKISIPVAAVAGVVLSALGAAGIWKIINLHRKNVLEKASFKGKESEGIRALIAEENAGKTNDILYDNINNFLTLIEKELIENLLNKGSVKKNETLDAEDTYTAILGAEDTYTAIEEVMRAHPVTGWPLVLQTRCAEFDKIIDYVANEIQKRTRENVRSKKPLVEQNEDKVLIRLSRYQRILTCMVNIIVSPAV